MNLNLFSKSGKFQMPPDDVWLALTDNVRSRVLTVADAAHKLEMATLAVEAAEAELGTLRAEIALIEKTLPRQTLTDLVKGVIAESNARRAGRA